MEARFYLLAGCLAILAGGLQAKQKEGGESKDGFDYGNNDWDKEEYNNNAYNGDGKTSEMIDIDDNPPTSQVYMGSGDQWVDDDYSGYGLDDEDSEGSADDEDSLHGSGAGMVKSPCERLKAELEEQGIVGAYMPRCTSDGAFEHKQCVQSEEECWCVDEMGREIDKTKRQKPAVPNCKAPKPEVIDRNPVKSEPKPEEEEEEEEEEIDNSIDNMPGLDTSVVIQTVPPETNEVEMLESKGSNMIASNVVMTQPGILAGIIGGAVVGLLCAVLLVMFIVYRMRKKDEGSYALDEPRRSPSLHTYSRATNKEFYA